MTTVETLLAKNKERTGAREIGLYVCNEADLPFLGYYLYEDSPPMDQQQSCQLHQSREEKHPAQLITKLHPYFVLLASVLPYYRSKD